MDKYRRPYSYLGFLENDSKNNNNRKQIILPS